MNELCRILHRLLFGSIKREHGPIHSPNICPPSEWTCCIVTASHPTERTMLADFAAHGRTRLFYREPHWTAPMRLTAAQPGLEATRWLSWYGVGLVSADRLQVVFRIPAGPLGSLKCGPPKGNGRQPKKSSAARSMAPAKSTTAPLGTQIKNQPNRNRTVSPTEETKPKTEFRPRYPPPMRGRKS